MTTSKEEYRLLIVEDNEREIDKYTDAIDILNDEMTDCFVKPTFKKTFAEGIKTLSNDLGYDGAVVDLKLTSRPESKHENGSVILKEIMERHRFPVVVYSGFTDDLSPDLRENTCFFKIYRRTDKSFKAILEELVNIYKTGLVSILGRNGLIDRYLNEIFWTYLARNMSFWVNEKVEDIGKILLRYTIAHLFEYLELDNDGKFEKYHPYEMYIIPPVKDKPFTGCIIKKQNENKYYILLSPSCDFAQGKSKNTVIAEIESIDMDYIKEAKLKTKSDDERLKKEGRRVIYRLITNTDSLKYHFLPPCQSFNGGFINFQKVHSIRYSDIANEYDMVASIVNNFVKDIVARFSHYYSRQGQPDMDYDSIYDKIIQAK